jgi:parvulin-like peptidyl-prolyl isomerase
MRWSVLFLSACLGWSTLVYGVREAGETVAKVGSEEITGSDLQKVLQRLHLGEHLLRDALQPLIDRKIMKLEAEARDLGEDSQVVSTLKQFERQRLVEKLYREEVSKKVAIPEAEIRNYFYRQGLDRKREVRGSHIVVATEEEAQRISRKLEEGVAFTQLAQEFSSDAATAAKGGDMGYWQEEDTLRSSFVRQLFALEEGKVSAPPYRDTGGNFHLIKATETRPVGFERQKRRIQEILERQEKNQRWTAYLDQQAPNAQFSVDQSTLAFLLRQGQRAIDRIPPVTPEHLGRILCRYRGGEINLGSYLEQVENTLKKRRPAPVDSGATVQFIRITALMTEILPRIAIERGWQQEEELRAALENKREELLVEKLRQTEVEEWILRRELLQAYYENHREDFTTPARTFFEGGILASHPEAQAVAKRARAEEALSEIMRSYPLFLGRFRKYDVFDFSPTDTTRRQDPLIEAARGMAAEEIKGPIQIRLQENRTGFVVLKLLEMRPPHLLPFTAPEVQRELHRKIRSERYEEIEAAFEQSMEKLRQKYASQIVIYQQVLDRLPTD